MLRINRPNLEYRLKERRNGSKYIQIVMYVNDVDGFIEVGRLKTTGLSWAENGYVDIEEVFKELKHNAQVTDFVAATNPHIMRKD